MTNQVRRAATGLAGAPPGEGIPEHDIPGATMLKSRTQEAAFSGRRIRTKILLALALSSVIPLLIFLYTLNYHLIPLLDPARYGTLGPSLGWLVAFTGLLMAAGGYVIWDVAKAVATAAEHVATARQLKELEERRDEVGMMMTSFSRMLTTIQRQAAEINAFAARLEAANNELEATNARLKEFSFKDEVTGLYNRRFFSIRLDEEISRYRRFNHPVSVVLMDVDAFKEINDDLGHAAGDETLREIAQLVLKHSRGINVIARYGGDEFIILLVETTKLGASAYAERLRQVVATSAFGHGRPITASFGVASVPQDVAASSEEIVRAADEALYSAKRAGKNTVAEYEPPPAQLEAEKVS
jgi:diguanylate cyclase (GGDEF)-like protein